MRAAAAVLAAWLGASCLPAVAPAADNAIDLRYRLRGEPSARDATPTRIYSWVGERSLSVPSRCKMVPTDSQAFAARCSGGIAAWYQGIARVLLEEASSTRFASGIELDGRWRWMDLAAPCE
jgi:hypothetical protein